MFKALDEREQQIVINAMQQRRFNQGDFVIKQGEDGDVLYVVDQGTLQCSQQFKREDPETFLKLYNQGDSFGELSLLYNAPRAATIQAKTQAVLFALDRACFNNIVKEAAVKRRERFEQVLDQVELLQSMDPYERIQLSDGMCDSRYQSGEYVIRKGEVGDKFYIVEQGKLFASQVLVEGNAEERVMSYQQGDYFGELSLVRNIPRQANVIAEIVWADIGDTIKKLVALYQIHSKELKSVESWVKRKQASKKGFI